MIEVKNLNFKYREDEQLVLNNVNLCIEKGSFVAILGANGSGKSTLAKMFNGLLKPDSGKVLVENLSTAEPSQDIEVRKKVGLVFQNPDNQLVATIVEEDVAFGPENLGISPAEIRTRVDSALEIVGMGEYKKHAPHKLSGGQKQRVAIAGILAIEPEYIVLDEPTSMLDPCGRREVISTIKTLNRRGITIILITHFMSEAALADRILVMNDGEVCLDDTPRKVFVEIEKLRSYGLDVPPACELSAEASKILPEFKPDNLTGDEFVEEFLAKAQSGAKA